MRSLEFFHISVPRNLTINLVELCSTVLIIAFSLYRSFSCVYTVYGKTFAVCTKYTIAILWKTFAEYQAVAIMYLHTASDSREKLSRSTEEPRTFFHSKVLPYTVSYTI